MTRGQDKTSLEEEARGLRESITVLVKEKDAINAEEEVTKERGGVEEKYSTKRPTWGISSHIFMSHVSYVLHTRYIYLVGAAFL